MNLCDFAVGKINQFSEAHECTPPKRFDNGWSDGERERDAV